jgi:ZIP family zinc transporter
MNTEHILLAFGLTLFAGLATGIGSIIAFTTDRTNKTVLSASLSFSAGVMIYVSFVEIFQKAKISLSVPLGEHMGAVVTTAAFFGGIALIALIDKLVPSHENPHELHKVEEMSDGALTQSQKSLYRVGIVTALAIALHNFPEGLATFIATIEDPKLGLHIAFAVAMHNIPEGIAVAVPIYFATGSRKKAFLYSFASGFAEPIGALIGYLLVMHFFNEMTFGILFSMVAGIMIYISFDQLLPAARTYGNHHVSVISLIAGMAVMAVSLLLFF